MATNVYQMVTDRIVEEMSKGIIPWHKPWTGVGATEGGAINYVSRKPYSLINQMLLGRPGEWLSWKQVEELGGKVKKGAKAGIVVFYTQLVIKDENPAVEETEEGTEVKPKTRTIPYLKYYHVFHLSDVDGIESRITEVEATQHEPISEAEAVIAGYLARETSLRFQNDKPSNRAYYSPAQDLVVVPMLSQYAVKEEYYSTAFHEFTHSTLTEGRCNRRQENANAFFGNEDYSREELVAEIGSAMLCNRVGIACEKALKNSVAYIQSWLKALRNDPKMIVWASCRAEKAARYILNEA